MSRRCGFQLRERGFPRVSALLACSTSACDLRPLYASAGSLQVFSLATILPMAGKWFWGFALRCAQQTSGEVAGALTVQCFSR